MLGNNVMPEGPPRARFDYASAGARHGLDETAASALWARAQRNATDVLGRGDLEEAQRLFHALARRLGPRGAR